MRHVYLKFESGQRRIFWPGLLVFILMAHVAVIGAAEMFWRCFTGGYSALIGGYALVAAILLVIRTVGASLAVPNQPLDAQH